MTMPPIEQPPQAPPPMAGPPQPPPMPWTPFAPMPTDDEPQIAAIRQRRLARLIDSAKFESFPPEWQQVAIAEYTRMRTIVSQAAQQAAMAAQPQKSQPKPAPQGAPHA